MDNEQKRRAEDAERPAAEELEWDQEALDRLKDGPTAARLAFSASRQPAAPAVDAAKLDELGKLKALAEAARDTINGSADAAFLDAADPAAILRIAALVAQQAARIAELVSGLAAAREMVGHPDNVAFIDRALAGATQHGVWVSVEDHFPEPGVPVLIAVQWHKPLEDGPGIEVGGGVYEGEYRANEYGGYMENYAAELDSRTEHITHWMHLPPMPDQSDASRFRAEGGNTQPESNNPLAHPADAGAVAVGGDAIAKSKRILALVDDFVERPTRDNRTALRCALMDEFEAASQPKATPLEATSERTANLQGKQIFEVAAPYFAWNANSWDKATKGTIGMPALLAYTKAAILADRAAQGEAGEQMGGAQVARDNVLESAVQAIADRAGDSDEIFVTSAYEAIRALKANRFALPESMLRAAPTTESAAAPADRFDEALATFLAEHIRLNQDGIDSHSMKIVLALNYAALNPVPESDIEEWREQGYIGAAEGEATSERKPLTRVQIMDIQSQIGANYGSVSDMTITAAEAFVQAVEQHHGIGGGKND